MTQSKWPMDGQAWTEAEFSEMFDLMLSTGVFRGVTNELETYGDSSGMQVKTKTGKAWMKGHFYKNDAEVTSAIAANSSGNPRIDRVVLRITWADNTLVLAVLEGTPAGSPAAPALTQTSAIWEISLAQVAVANGAATITAGNVTDERRYANQGVKTHRKDDATNSGQAAGSLCVQSGWGYIQGDGTTKLEEAVTFPTAFDAAPIVLVSFLGEKSSAGVPDSIDDFSMALATVVAPHSDAITTSGCNVNLVGASVFANGGTGEYYGYSWVAIGAKA